MGTKVEIIFDPEELGDIEEAARAKGESVEVYVERSVRLRMYRPDPPVSADSVQAAIEGLGWTKPRAHLSEAAKEAVLLVKRSVSNGTYSTLSVEQAIASLSYADQTSLNFRGPSSLDSVERAIWALPEALDQSDLTEAAKKAIRKLDQEVREGTFRGASFEEMLAGLSPELREMIEKAASDKRN